MYDIIGILIVNGSKLHLFERTHCYYLEACALAMKNQGKS